MAGQFDEKEGKDTSNSFTRRETAPENLGMAQNTPCGYLSANAKRNGAEAGLDIRLTSYGEVVLSIRVDAERKATLVAGTKHYHIEFPPGRRGRYSVEEVAAFSHTSAGDLYVEWMEWGHDPIPPNGVIGWVNLVTPAGPRQIVTLYVDETGERVMARFWQTYPCGGRQRIVLCEKRAAQRIWDVGGNRPSIAPPLV